jgi:hypothetical protein
VSNRTPKPQASITSEQALALIDQMIQDIEDDRRLRLSVFGISVRLNLRSMRSRLRDGARMTLRMEESLQNWNRAIHRDHKASDGSVGSNTLQ